MAATDLAAEPLRSTSSRLQLQLALATATSRDLQQQLDRAREALLRYGRHREGCNCGLVGSGCSCGLRAALAACGLSVDG